MALFEAKAIVEWKKRTKLPVRCDSLACSWRHNGEIGIIVHGKGRHINEIENFSGFAKNKLRHIIWISSFSNGKTAIRVTGEDL
jgi:hypothetical protein